MASLKKEVRALVELHVSFGFRVELGKNSHYKVYDQDNRLVSVFPGTPSDCRSLKNAEATLRRIVRARDNG